jgi:hypothetical protein
MHNEDLKSALKIATKALLEAASFANVDDCNGEAGKIAFNALRELQTIQDSKILIDMHLLSLDNLDSPIYFKLIKK